jgi:DnaK suppressor protein
MTATGAVGGRRSWPGMDERLGRERASAVEQITTLSRLTAEIIAASRDVATDDEHDPEGQTIAFERAQAGALLDRARVRLSDIEAALARLRNDTYGICERCGRSIAVARLEARPMARTCIACASRRY